MHVLLTGASSGIGEALAKAFGQAGYDLSLVARRQAELERVASEASGSAQAKVYSMDLTDLDAVAGLAERAEAGLGPIDVLINNAGMQLVGPTVGLGNERAEKLLTLNVMAPFRLTRAVLEGMIERRSGTIVDIASLAALAPTPGMFDYSASKSALAGASEALRAEVRHHGIHVVTVYPGPVKTAMADAAVAHYDGDPTKGMPVGSTEVLAKRVLRAVQKKRKRIVYPRAYHLVRTFPNLSRWVIDKMAPIPE